MGEYFPAKPRSQKFDNNIVLLCVCSVELNGFYPRDLLWKK